MQTIHDTSINNTVQQYIDVKDSSSFLHGLSCHSVDNPWVSVSAALYSLSSDWWQALVAGPGSFWKPWLYISSVMLIHIHTQRTFWKSGDSFLHCSTLIIYVSSSLLRRIHFCSQLCGSFVLITILSNMFLFWEPHFTDSSFGPHCRVPGLKAYKNTPSAVQPSPHLTDPHKRPKGPGIDRRCIHCLPVRHAGLSSMHWTGEAAPYSCTHSTGLATVASPWKACQAPSA